MRVLLGGIVGAALAVTAWLALEHYSQSNLGWLACLVGFVTGLSVRWANGASTKGRVLRGALSIALTLVAIVGGRQVYVKVIQATMAPVAGIVVAKVPEANADEAINEEEPTDQPAQILSDDQESIKPGAFAGQPGKKYTSLNNTFSEWDTLWMCLAALAAYLIGTKSVAATKSESADDVSVSVE